MRLPGSWGFHRLYGLLGYCARCRWGRAPSQASVDFLLRPRCPVRWAGSWWPAWFGMRLVSSRPRRARLGFLRVVCAPCARCDNGLIIIGFDNDRYRSPSALCAHHVPRKPCVLGSGLRPQGAFIGAVLLCPLHPQPCHKPHAHPPPWFVLAVVSAARTVITLRLGLRDEDAGGLHWRGFAMPPAPSALPQAACPPPTLVVCLSGSTFRVFLDMLVGVGGSTPGNPRHNNKVILIYFFFPFPCLAFMGVFPHAPRGVYGWFPLLRCWLTLRCWLFPGHAPSVLRPHFVRPP